MSERHLVVVGLMGVGKTTTAEALAAATGRLHLDSDTDIERARGRSGREIAAELGVDELHRIEAEVLLDALACPEPAVISAAASVVEDPAVREALAGRAFVVHLTAPLDVIVERQSSGDHRRPMTAEDVALLAARRRRYFLEVADLVVDATSPIGEQVQLILAAE